jgi:MFS family permease
LSADTARVLITVGVNGSEVGRYSARWQSPPNYGRLPAKPVVLQATGWLFGALVLTLAVSALVWTLRRQRADVLRWTTAARLCAVGAAGLLIFGLYPETLTELASDNSSLAASLTLIFLMGLIIATWFVLLLALVESLASERRPTLMSGIHDLAAGRFVIPEMPVAALYGIVGGLVMVALGELVRAASVRWSPRTYHGFEDALDYSFPTILLIAAVALALTAATLVPYVLLVVERWRIPRWTMFLAPALLFVGIQAGFASFTPWMLAISAINAGALTLIVWRYGWLSGVVAMLVLTQITGIVATLRFGGDDVRLPTLLSLAILAAPIFIGVSAYRRYNPIRPTRSTPTSA